RIECVPELGWDPPHEELRDAGSPPRRSGAGAFALSASEPGRRTASGYLSSKGYFVIARRSRMDHIRPATHHATIQPPPQSTPAGVLSEGREPIMSGIN